MKIKIYLILFCFALIHELTHLIVGVKLNFKPKKFTIMPFGFGINFKINYEDYNIKIKKGSKLSIKKIIVYSAGPVINILLFLVFEFLNIKKCKVSNLEEMIYCNLALAIFNLIPIYPLDGGRILQEVVHIFWGLRISYKVVQDVSLVSISIITAFIGIMILYFRNVVLLGVLGYLWLITLKYQKMFSIKEKIYENLNKYTKSSNQKY